MKNRSSLFALILSTLFVGLLACTKNETPLPIAEEPKVDYIPDASRVGISFGTSTQFGCISTFRNCIYIDFSDILRTSAITLQNQPGLEFANGAEADRYYGRYFPLTDETANFSSNNLGAGPQLKIPAGFYPLSYDTVQGTGKRLAMLVPGTGIETGNLVNPNNPQDYVGQLHNLAAQEVLHQYQKNLDELKGNRSAIQAFLAEKIAEFLAKNGLAVSNDEVKRAKTLDIYRDYTDYAARLNETRLSAADKKTLLAIFDQVNNILINEPGDLRTFLNWMTEAENNLVAQKSQLDDAKTVLSMVSVLKYSRYYWYWRGLSFPQAGSSPATRVPYWV